MATIVEQIVNREIDSVIVYESDQVIAFADHDPINFGHILICPKTQYRTFIDLPESVFFEITDVARDLYKRIEANHYHLHIFPRFHGDQYGWVSSELGIQTMDKLRESLKDL
ncbi:HIT family protein [Vibrio parahaemolyticus]|nr:HIT family protein [Vibrio parahaemolyticus]